MRWALLGWLVLAVLAVIFMAITAKKGQRR